MRFYYQFLFLLSLISLPGCTTNNVKKMNWEAKATRTSTAVSLKFESGGIEINSLVKNRLRTHIRNPQDTYFRLFSPGKDLKKPASLRIQRIITYLSTLGVPRQNIDLFEQDYKDSVNTMVLIIDHYERGEQSCPGWNQEMNAFLPPEGEINFGCATERNFTAMVADPRVINSGRKLGDTDANRSNRAIENYRLGTLKKMKIEKIEKQ